MVRYGVACDTIRCPSCGSLSDVLGSIESERGRAFHCCQCQACLLMFDRIVAPNGKGMTVLYAVPSSERTARPLRIVGGSQREEDERAS